MSTEKSGAPLYGGDVGTEVQWRAALVRAEQLRLEYSQRSGSADTAEQDLEELWLLLWHAERRREALYRALE